LKLERFIETNYLNLLFANIYSMYGIVNKSLEELVKANFGEAKWHDVLQLSDIKIDYFVSNEPYDDEITYKIAIAISEIMQMPLREVLFVFGEWWILKTTQEKYGGLLRAGGENLKEFLINLPSFHNHIMLMYPKLTPPEFKVSDIQNNSIHIHYFSKRVGLQEFVHVLLSGLGKLYKVETSIQLLTSRDNNNDHEIFSISW